MKRAPRRPKEEYLLLLLAAAAAGTAAIPAVEGLPSRPALWGATALALALALATAFAFWFSGAVRRSLWKAAEHEDDAVRAVLAAIPDALLIVDGDRIVAANRVLCDLLGYGPDELAGTSAPFAFWPPEHRHEIASWHAALGTATGSAQRLMLAHRSGERIPALVAAREIGGVAGRYVVSMREVSESYRRERRLAELTSRDPETALLDERGFEASLRAAVRRARTSEKTISVAVLDLRSIVPGASPGLGTPDALIAIDRLQRTLRAGDELARTHEDEIAWILPDTSWTSAVEAVARARAALADLGVTLTAGVSDLETAGDVPSLFALADRALVEARRRGVGTTVGYAELSAADVSPRAQTV